MLRQTPMTWMILLTQLCREEQFRRTSFTPYYVRKMLVKLAFGQERIKTPLVIDLKL
jgi:hypothetical protein